jgi:hypothetical protein
MGSEHIQGDEGGAYVALACFSMMHHGMAYGARALGSRSRHSSRGSHAPPGSRYHRAQGEGRQGTGWTGTREVRMMRNAETILDINDSGPRGLPVNETVYSPT